MGKQACRLLTLCVPFLCNVQELQCLSLGTLNQGMRQIKAMGEIILGHMLVVELIDLTNYADDG